MMQDPLILMFKMPISLPDDGSHEFNNVIKPHIDQPNLDYDLNNFSLETKVDQTAIPLLTFQLLNFCSIKNKQAEL